MRERTGSSLRVRKPKFPFAVGTNRFLSESLSLSLSLSCSSSLLGCTLPPCYLSPCPWQRQCGNSASFSDVKMPKKGIDVVGPVLWDENLNGIPDGVYDNVIKHIDFPLEDVDGNGLGDDWDARFQLLELPSSDILAGLPSGFDAKLCNDDSGPASTPSEYEEKPKLKDSLQGNMEATSEGNIFFDGIKDSSLFQNTSAPVSVLESGNSRPADNSVHSGFRFVAPVKRARSKRHRQSTLNPKLASITFMLCSEKRRAKKKNISVLSSGGNSDDSSLLSNGMRKCSHCEVTKTPQWREGPMGPKTLCNACGVRYRSGRLFPEYRPAASPTFITSLHSNSHKKVIEMRKKASLEGLALDDSLRPPVQQLENSSGCLSV